MPDAYFLEVAVDITGGTNYQVIGTTQIVSVPYALQAEKAADLSKFTVDNDLLTYDTANTEWVGKSLSINNNGSGQAHNITQPSLGLNYIISLFGTFPSPSRYTERGPNPFYAEIILFAGNFAPQGWAFCHGQLLPISSNTALFSILGTQYGGDGITTFALPDLRGRVPVGVGNGPGLSNVNEGQQFGAETHVLTTSQMPSHNHGTTLTQSTRKTSQKE
ncbi:tail fiber protein [Sungkyunkwania multivorans]|uniref:Tail fiber protein n=1 Tax=Sungkyunkwania multivorans TaxID=1173618 RepID=A0ABW3CSY0_9FLAO